MTSEKKTTTTRTWSDDLAAESILRFAEVTWVVKAIALDDIDWDASGLNSARLWSPFNADTVQRYKSGLEAGDVFPRVVVEATASGYFILGGNRRSAAARDCGETTIDAYVIKPLTTIQREICIRSLNSRHGEGIDKDERISQAVYLVMSCGVMTEDAARLQCISASAVSENVRSQRVKSRLAAKGLDVSSVPVVVLASLSKIADDKTAMRLGQIIIEYAPTQVEVRDVVKAVLASSSAAVTNKRINEFELSLKNALSLKRSDGSTVQRPNRKRFISSLSRLSEFLERGNEGTGFSSLDELQCIPEDLTTIITSASKVVLRLKMIAGIQ